MDMKTCLMWASEDNGYDIKWKDAKRYCENYRGGGYTDWRMPTIDELAGLYDYEFAGLYDESESYQIKQRNYDIHTQPFLGVNTPVYAPFSQLRFPVTFSGLKNIRELG